MRKTLLIIASLAGLLASCSPQVSVNIINQRPPLEGEGVVGFVYAERDSVPNAEMVGEINVTPGLSNLMLPYNISTIKAAKEARKIGGNVIRITSQDNLLKGNSFTGDILYAEDTGNLRFFQQYRSWRSIPKKRFEINAGIGGEALIATNEFLLGVMDRWYYGPESVTDMYLGCYDANISTTVSLEWAYYLNNRWAIVGSFGGNRVNATYFNPYTGAELNRETLYSFDIMAGARIRWYVSENVSEKFVTVYSQVQLGLAFHTPGEYWSRNSMAQNKWAYQLTPVGVTFGSNLYGFGEFGWGTEYIAIGIITGARVGVGYRF